MTRWSVPPRRPSFMTFSSGQYRNGTHQHASPGSHHNPRVGGSSPSSGTSLSPRKHGGFVVLGLARALFGATLGATGVENVVPHVGPAKSVVHLLDVDVHGRRELRVAEPPLHLLERL